MKLILTSPDLLLTCEKKADCERTIEVLTALTNEDCIIVFTSSDQRKFKELPENFYTLQVNNGEKRSPKGFIAKVLKETKFDSPQDIIVLGANDSDCIMAFNNKLLLFTPHWLLENENNEKIFKYGIGLRAPDSLKLLIDNFLEMNKNPWYYTVKVSDTTTMYSLISANTYGKTGSEVELANAFRKHLKDGVKENRIQLLVYFMVSCHYNLEDLRSVNYIGIYPSSSDTENPDLEYFKETLRLQHNIKLNKPLLIRQKAVPQRHGKQKDWRIKEGCDSQFDSIIINPALKGRLEGKTVCIIDDFTTYGTSCEAVRHLFEHENVQSLIFITLGKFGSDYYKYNYAISGDVYDKYTHKQIDECTKIMGTFNRNESAMELVKRLGHIL